MGHLEVTVKHNSDRYYARGQNQVKMWLQTFATASMRGLKPYPEWMPWTSPPPKTGPRAGGKRTGTLGKNWTMKVAKGEASVLNATEYAKWVQGPTNSDYGASPSQARHMQRRNWKSTSSVIPGAVKQANEKTKF